MKRYMIDHQNESIFAVDIDNANTFFDGKEVLVYDGFLSCYMETYATFAEAKAKRIKRWESAVRELSADLNFAAQKLQRVVELNEI